MLKWLLDTFKPAAGGRSGQVRIVDAASIRQWHADGKAVIIDVREREEHAAEAIADAINLPLSSFDPASVPRPAAGQHLVLHCQAGMRCAPASARLVAAGWDGEIVRMKDGLNGWKAAGGATRRR